MLQASQTFEQILPAWCFFLQPISLSDSSSAASICHLLSHAREKERRDDRGGGTVMCSNFSSAPTASLFSFHYDSPGKPFASFYTLLTSISRKTRPPRNRMVALTASERYLCAASAAARSTVRMGGKRVKRVGLNLLLWSTLIISRCAPRESSASAHRSVIIKIIGGILSFINAVMIHFSENKVSVVREARQS
jgi:hypothetical protein